MGRELTRFAMHPHTLSSAVDQSVNHIAPTGDGGAFESRFVRRVTDYFICYLSSHTGCGKACRFCHLTATGQTMMKPASHDDYVRQAQSVFEDYRRAQGRPDSASATRVHFNFMARGEPLENPCLIDPVEFDRLHSALRDMADEFGLETKFKVSSIIPEGYSGAIDDFTGLPGVQLYYRIRRKAPSFRAGI